MKRRFTMGLDDEERDEAALERRAAERSEENESVAAGRPAIEGSCAARGAPARPEDPAAPVVHRQMSIGSFSRLSSASR
jgi:hypothetical protein